MYWTHLIFALLHGLLISWNKISASKPGYLDFDNLPETNFSCDGKVIGGYYADVETGCQMFHVCTIGQKGEVTDIKFLCLNGTVFDQETRVCERIDEVDCSKSEDFFGLNLELYGNNANFGGIQAENEFETEGECGEDEECVTDEEYEESEEGTTLPVTSTTTTTTPPSTTRPPPSTTPSTTRPPPSTTRPYQGDPLHALLALHSAFNKPAPPRVINNAFSPTAKPTPARPYPTRRPPDLNYKSRYTPDSQSYGSLNLQQRERPYYFTPPTEKSNYHHFHSGDTSFGHSFDATRPYNFQYFHSRKLPEDKASVSVVTSTSTSTSVKTSKTNATEYPTGYDDYQDDIEDHTYFEDVPKLRQRRELHPNHKYDEEGVTTPRHKNHRYDDELTRSPDNEREEFLHNLLGSIDLDDQVRDKMTDFFKKEDKEMEHIEEGDTPISSIENKIGQIFTQDMDLLKTDDKKSKTDKLIEWTKHFDEMTKDINLNYTFEVNFTQNNDENVSRQKREAQKTDNTRSTISPSFTDRSQPRRTNIDTEHFRVESRRKKPAKDQAEYKPVFESIEDDFTTIEYRRSSKFGRSQPKSTTSLRAFTFNYEVTSAIPEPERRHLRISKLNAPTSKEIVDFVHEETEPFHTISREVASESSQEDIGESLEEVSPRERNKTSQRKRVVVAKRTRPVDQSSKSSTKQEVEESPRRQTRVRQQGARKTENESRRSEISPRRSEDGSRTSAVGRRKQEHPMFVSHRPHISEDSVDLRDFHSSGVSQKQLNSEESIDQKEGFQSSGTPQRSHNIEDLVDKRGFQISEVSHRQQNSEKVNQRGVLQSGDNRQLHNSEDVDKRSAQPSGVSHQLQNSKEVDQRGVYQRGDNRRLHNSEKVDQRSFRPSGVSHRQQNSEEVDQRDVLQSGDNRQLHNSEDVDQRSAQPSGFSHQPQNSKEVDQRGVLQRGDNRRLHNSAKVDQRSFRPSGVSHRLQNSEEVDLRSARPSGVSHQLHNSDKVNQRGIQASIHSPEESVVQREQLQPSGLRNQETQRKAGERNRMGKHPRGRIQHQTTTGLPTLAPRPTLTPDPDFSCEGRVKGGFYADTYNDCRAFFICSQGMVDGPLLKTHFACGDKTKFNQRSRTCQAEDLVECEISARYFHLNNDFLVPVSEDELRGGFEPMKER